MSENKTNKNSRFYELEKQRLLRKEAELTIQRQKFKDEALKQVHKKPVLTDASKRMISTMGNEKTIIFENRRYY